MSKFTKSFLILMIAVLFSVSSAAYARPSFNPKGWSKGKKKGWEGESTPPGLSKKEAKKLEKEAKETKKEMKEEGKELKEDVKDAAEEVKEKANS